MARLLSLRRLPNTMLPCAFPLLRRLIFRRTTTSLPSPQPAAALADGDHSAASAEDDEHTVLTAADTDLVARLFSLLVDHHRSEPSSLPHPHPSIPSLSFSQASPSPPSPAAAAALLRRVAALKHGVPVAQTLAFFRFYLSSSSSSSSSPSASALYNAVIDLSAKHGHFDVAHHLLDEMRDLSIPITTRNILSLVRRHVRAGRVDDAIALFRRMPDYSLDPPTPATLTSLIAVLSKKRCATNAQAVFDAFKAAFPPDVVLYSALIHAWCRAGRLDEAERIFRQMHNEGITPNAYTYTMVIDALCRNGQLPRAHELLCHMLSSESPDCRPTTATFNAIMRMHMKAGRPEQVLQVRNQMRQLGCQPDIITCNFLIATHCGDAQRNLDAALKVLARMSGMGVAPNCNSFNPILKLALSTGNVGVAHRLRERMREGGIKGNVVTYNLLIELFGKKEGSLEMVMRVKEEMEAERVDPNVNTYRTLIKVYCGRGNWRRAYEAAMEMVVVKRLRPGNDTYETVIMLLRKAGQLRKAEELSEAMVAAGFVTPSAALDSL